VFIIAVTITKLFAFGGFVDLSVSKDSIGGQLLGSWEGPAVLLLLFTSLAHWCLRVPLGTDCLYCEDPCLDERFV
jgi:hypothetical protein